MADSNSQRDTKPTDQDIRAQVTRGLNDQKTLQQLSSSGIAAQNARPNAMARNDEAAGAANDMTATGNQSEREGEKK